MKIIVDAMGGDRAPFEIIKGAYAASLEYDAKIVLVGDRMQIEQIAEENEYDLKEIEIVDTKVKITMEDDPLCVVRGKQDSSMSVGLRMLAEGHGDAFVSTGNTGALFTGATLIVRKAKGVLRAGIGAIVPMQLHLIQDNQLGMVKLDKSQVHYMEMDTGDRMILAAAASNKAENSAGLVSRLAQTFSVVLEYLN